ncbi:MAG TPA: PPOX class F420-dependent oxidoreductase [Dehalococcoidia bacterium]|nr:PPOX class F420-dependent oxidoreductase [Dehalococcoidia bacterium]
MSLSENVRKLAEGKTYCIVATTMRDGSPQTSLVWVDTDGEHVIFNTDERRLKAKNLRRDPRVAITLVSPENAYDMAMIRGRAVEFVRDGADAHLDKLAKKYLGADSYPFRQPDDERVMIKVAVDRVATMQ